MVGSREVDSGTIKITFLASTHVFLSFSSQNFIRNFFLAKLVAHQGWDVCTNEKKKNMSFFKTTFTDFGKQQKNQHQHERKR